MTQRYMNVHETAVYLGITEAAVRQKVYRRCIPFIKDGRSVRFDKDDLDRDQATKKQPRRKKKGGTQ